MGEGDLGSNEDIQGLKNIYYIMPDECFPQIIFILEKLSVNPNLVNSQRRHLDAKEASDYPTILHKSLTELLIS